MHVHMQPKDPPAAHKRGVKPVTIRVFMTGGNSDKSTMNSQENYISKIPM